MSELVLYVDGFLVSPYAFSVYVSARELQIPFELRPLSLAAKEHHEPAYVAGSLTGMVPAIRHGGFWLSESLAITEYLGEAFPGAPRIFPADVKDRARCRQLMMWFRTDLMPIREQRPSHSMFYERVTAPLDARGQEALARLLAVAETLVPADRTTLFDRWCIADADFGFMLQRLNLNGEPLPAKVKRYAEAQWERPSVKEWVRMDRPAYVPY